jgi:hypothetical protein
MKLILLLLAVFLGTLSAQTAKRPSSRLAVEPGTIHVEDILPKAVFMKVMQDSPIYVSSKLDRAIGSMAPGTIVKLVGMSDTAFRVRGKARHGDTSGWLPTAAVAHPDPNLVTNLKKLHERQTKVEELIAAHQIALGMTGEEVASSLGKPTRKSSKLSTTGKEEKIDVSKVDVSMNGIELQDREFFAAIREGREPNASVAQVLPCYEVLHLLEQQLA